MMKIASVLYRIGISVGVFVLLALLAFSPSAAASEPSKVSLATTNMADSNPVTFGAITHNCGVATCSAYISRSGTKELSSRVTDNWGTWMNEAGTCGLVSLTPAIGGPLAVYCGFRYEQFKQALETAADTDRCLKVTYLKYPFNVTHVSPSSGQFCKK